MTSALEITIERVSDETEFVLAPNQSFSQMNKFMQLAWDSTSLGALKTCPRYYYYTIICGYMPRAESAHLRFGIEFHHALEFYDRLLAQGIEHDLATVRTVREALIRTWNKETNRPWASDEPAKNRETLVRTIVWYLDQFAQDPLETVILANGQPAVELSFRFDSGIETEQGEPILICGHLDRLALMKIDDRKWIVDRKTTRGSIGESYFERYSPDNQMSIYDIGGQVVYREGTAGIIIDVAQIGVTFSRFQRGFVMRTVAQREEWLADFEVWIRLAEGFARAQRWPQNEKACDAHSSYSEDHDAWRNGCPFRPVCGSTPELRPRLLSGLYDRRVWDPLETREAKE